jgi:hypothetical protein
MLRAGDVATHGLQVEIDDARHGLLRSRARRERKSVAARVREALDAFLGTGDGGEDPFRRVVGIGKGDGSAVVENHEDYRHFAQHGPTLLPG